MKKKHFIVLGRVGLTYFSWLAIIFFISLILAYESTSNFNWTAVGCGLIFFLLLAYTFLNSYWDSNNLKLPFKGRTTINHAPRLLYQWHWCKIFKVQGSEPEQYYLLRIVKP